MAKGKESAVSMFASMQKVNNKVTDEVKEETKVEAVEANETNEDNASKKANRAKEAKKEDAVPEIKMTEEVDDNKETKEDSKDTITDDILTKEEEITEEEAGDADTRGSKNDKGLMHIHIALPKDVYDKLETGKKAYYNNKTTYIRNLILDDYEKNKDYYERLPKIR